MSDVRLPLEFFVMLERMPSWRVKRLVSHVRVYAATGFVEDVKPKLWEAFALAKGAIDRQQKIKEQRKKCGSNGAKNRWNGKKMAKNIGVIAKNSGVIAKNSGAIHDSLPDFKAEIHNILGADYE